MNNSVRHIPQERFAGQVPAPFAVYRPAGVGAFASEPLLVSALATLVGVGLYSGPATIDLESLRGLDAHVNAREEAKTRMLELHAETNGAPFDEAQQAEFEALVDGIAALDTRIDQLRTREALIQQVTEDPAATRVERPGAYGVPNVVRRATPDNIYDIEAYGGRVRNVSELPGLYRDGAMRAIEAMSFPVDSTDPDKARARLERLVTKHANEDYGWVSQHIIGTSDPVYLEAYADYIRGRHLNGRRMAVMQSYSDTDGGFSLPAAIDPTFIDISDGSANPLRAISRIETTTAKTWSAITTAGVVASYRSEATRSTTGAADSAPTDLDNPTVTPAVADTSVDLTMDYLQDYGSAALLGELGTLIATAKDDLEADKFVLGDGSDEPEGIVAAIITDTTSIVTTTTNDAFLLADIDKLIGALPNRFRGLQKSRFVANNAILQKIPAFGVAGQDAGSIYSAQSQTLRGYPVHEASAMDDVTTDAKHVLLFGDFRHFVIVDRLGLTTKVGEQRDGSGRMTGGTSVYAAWRNSSKVLAFNAFRLLEID